jgi:hypothetical protein
VDSRHTDHEIMNCVHIGYSGWVIRGPHNIARFFCFRLNPNSGIRAWSMCSMLVRLEHTLIVWAPLLHLSAFHTFAHNCGLTWWSGLRPTLFVRSYARLVLHLTYGSYHTCNLPGDEGLTRQMSYIKDFRSGERQRWSSGSKMAHDVPRFTSPRWRIATSC